MQTIWNIQNSVRLIFTFNTEVNFIFIILEWSSDRVIHDKNYPYEYIVSRNIYYVTQYKKEKKNGQEDLNQKEKRTLALSPDDQIEKLAPYTITPRARHVTSCHPPTHK